MTWVIRWGRGPKMGSYWSTIEGRSGWWSNRSKVIRFDDYQNACRVLGDISASSEARLVRLKKNWRPRCGDRVRILVDDQKDRLAFVTNTERPERIFVSVPSLNCVTVGPYAPKDLALEAAAKPGTPSHQRGTE